MRRLLLCGLIVAALCAAAAVPARAQGGGAIDTAITQYLLIWTGDYVGMVDGVAGPRTQRAISAFSARRLGGRPLDGRTFDRLVMDALDAWLEVGFVPVRDPTLGVVYGLPQRLVSPVAGAGPGRALFRSRDTALELEITDVGYLYGSLAELYDRLSTLPERTITYASFQPTWFVLSGTVANREFYVRYEWAGDRIKGFSFSQAAGRLPAWQRISVAMSNVFRTDPNAADFLVTFLEDLERPRPAGPPAAPPRQAPGQFAEASGSGFVIDRIGHVLTNAHVVAGCDAILLGDGQPVRVIGRDDADDLALVEAPSLRGRPALRFRADGARLGEEVVAAGFPLSDLLADSLNITPGIVSSLSGLGGDTRYIQTTAPIQPGNSGGPLLDRGGSVIGIVAAKLRGDGFIPEGVNFAIREATIRPFLVARHVAPATDPTRAATLSIEEIAARVRPSVVSVHCLTQRPANGPLAGP